MKPSQVAFALKQNILLDIPSFISGPSGAGKSAVVHQVHQELMSNDPDFQIIDLRWGYLEQVDLIGVPWVANGKTTYHQPAQFPFNPDWRGIIFADEMNLAVKQMLGLAYQFVHERKLGPHTLPKGARIVAAGNRTQDRGVTHTMPDPLVDRFDFLEYEIDLTDWCNRAIIDGIRPEVIGYPRFRPEHLHLHTPDRKGYAFTTPRGYYDVSKLIDHYESLYANATLRNDQEMIRTCESAAIRGRIGQEVGNEFLAYLRMFREMVSPDQILLNPTGAPIPANSSILYALAEALARRATIKNWSAVMTYIKRIRKEYAQCCISSATRLTPALCNTPETIQWFCDNQ